MLEPIYFKGILPSVTYGINVWGNSSEAKLGGLEKIHLSAAKLIFKQQIPPSWKSINYFHKKRLLCLTHKAYYGVCPEKVATIIKKSPNLRHTRDNMKLNLVPRPSLLFLPCRRGERPWLRLVTCLCIPIKAAPGVGPQLNFSTGQFNSV